MKPYTLTELNLLISRVLEDNLAPSYRVSAEIAAMSEKGGHLYLDLVEKSEHGLLAAKQRATCWSRTRALLIPYFEQTTGQKLRPGMQVLLEVEVTFHPQYGMGLNILDIDPTYTLGDMARQKQATIRRLEEDGVIGMQKELEIPRLPLRIAVVSAEQAAGYGDFCQQLHERPYRWQPQLFAATMQGENAAPSIAQALERIAKEEERFDVVVIIRGGGATSDLSCFDDYLLASHCAQFPLPILTGIGHTRDVSIVDMVAHAALKTPTAVATFLCDRVGEEIALLEQLQVRLSHTAERQILLRQRAVEQLVMRWEHLGRRLIIQEENRLLLLEQQLKSLNPETIYGQGYSRVTKGNKVIRSVKEVQSGDQLTIWMGDGEVQVRVMHDA